MWRIRSKLEQLNCVRAIELCNMAQWSYGHLCSLLSPSCVSTKVISRVSSWVFQWISCSRPFLLCRYYLLYSSVFFRKKRRKIWDSLRGVCLLQSWKLGIRAIFWEFSDSFAMYFSKKTSFTRLWKPKKRGLWRASFLSPQKRLLYLRSLAGVKVSGPGSSVGRALGF